MKTIAFGFFVSLLLGAPAFAHGGGLNSQGCHTNRKTGEYHCHRKPAKPAPAPLLRRNTPTTKLRPAPPINRAYRNCDEARAAGAAPVRRGELGYGPHLDRDNDGIGCE